MAYSNLAQLRMLDHDLEGTLLWGNRAIALAEELGETETLIHALTNVGTARHYAGDERGVEELTRSLQLALDGGLLDHAARALANLACTTLLAMRLDEAERRLATAIAFAIEHDLDFRRGYLLATRAALRARQGSWDAAETEIRQLLRQPMLSSVTRMVALTTLAKCGLAVAVPRLRRRSTRRWRWLSAPVNCCAWDRSAPRAPKRPY